METLTSRSNPRLRHVSRLREGRYRRQAGQFAIDGVREIERAVDAGIELAHVYLATAVLETPSPALSDLLARIPDQVPQVAVVPHAFERIAFGQRNEGMVAVAKTPPRKLAQLSLPANPLLLVADGVEKPGNLGAIFRSADAAGVDAVVCSDCATDLFHPHVIRASLGAVFALPAARATGEQARQFLQQHRVTPFAARVDASEPLWECDFTGPTAVVVGAEAEGLGAAWRTRGIRIPMAGIADSLNVSVAAAVLIFEARRQRWQNMDYRSGPQNR